MTNFESVALLLLIGNLIMNFFLLRKMIFLLKKKKMQNSVQVDDKKQDYHEYDLQHRLENFQKMKFASMQPKSRLPKL
jgi:hypothetical protein